MNYVLWFAACFFAAIERQQIAVVLLLLWLYLMKPSMESMLKAAVCRARGLGLEDCPRGGKHIAEVGYGGDFCIKCGKVNPE